MGPVLLHPFHGLNVLVLQMYRFVILFNRDEVCALMRTDLPPAAPSDIKLVALR
jgi:hypothetical protein